MTAAPSMAEVLEKALRAQGLTDEPERHDSDIHGWRCSYPDIYGRCDCFAEAVRDVAQALAAAGFGHVASVEEERWAATVAAVTPCACSAQRARAEAAEAQVADLKRWKDEALPVMSGLQELGRALGLPLGERITGERALEAVEALVGQVAAVRAVLVDGPDTWEGYESRDTGATFLQESVLDFTADLRRALDGEGGR